MLAGFDPDLLIFLLFLLLPVFGRVLRGLGERGKGAAEGGDPRRGARAARKDRGAEARGPAPADEARELEHSGEEIWRRLLEGLAPEQPPAAAPPPPPAPPAPPVKRRVEPRVQPDAASRPVPAPPAGRTPATSSSGPESAARPSVASSMRRGALRLPGLAPSELSDPSELGELEPVGQLGQLTRRPTPRDLAARTASRSISVSTAPEDLRRAVLWSEILAPPVALRWPDGSPWH